MQLLRRFLRLFLSQLLFGVANANAIPPIWAKYPVATCAQITDFLKTYCKYQNNAWIPFQFLENISYDEKPCTHCKHWTQYKIYCASEYHKLWMLYEINTSTCYE